MNIYTCLLSCWQEVWPPGLHAGPPWLKVSNLVTQQSVVFDMPVKGCKTRDNVSVTIDVAIVFRIMGDASKVSLTTHKQEGRLYSYSRIHKIVGLGPG